MQVRKNAHLHKKRKCIHGRDSLSASIYVNCAMNIFKFFPLIGLVFSLFSCDATTKTDLSTIQAASKAIQEQPRNAEFRYARAKLYLDEGKADSALTDMLNVIKLDSSKSEYFVTLGDAYLILNQTRFTRKALESAIRINANDTIAMMKLAELFLFAEMRKESLNQVNSVLRINQKNPKAYYLKGIIYKEIGDTALAISSLLTATEQDPKYILAYEQLGLLYGARYDIRAVDFYKNALRIEPGNELIKYNLGYFYQQMDSLNDAVNTYQEILASNPNFAQASYNLGYIAFQFENNYSKALSFFTQAAKANPGYAEAKYMMGLCYEELGEKQKALPLFEEAIRLNPKFDKAEYAAARLQKK